MIRLLDSKASPTFRKLRIFDPDDIHFVHFVTSSSRYCNELDRRKVTTPLAWRQTIRKPETETALCESKEERDMYTIVSERLFRTVLFAEQGVPPKITTACTPLICLAATSLATWLRAITADSGATRGLHTNATAGTAARDAREAADAQ